MIKRLVAIILTVCFLLILVTPDSSSAGIFNNWDSEQDQSQQRAVSAAIGIVAIVGVIFMLSRLSSTAKLEGDDSNTKLASQKALGSGDTKPGIKVGLDFEKAMVSSRADRDTGLPANEWKSPELAVSLSW